MGYHDFKNRNIFLTGDASFACSVDGEGIYRLLKRAVKAIIDPKRNYSSEI